jgi:membrane fusion protein (multidrug efflux system)
MIRFSIFVAGAVFVGGCKPHAPEPTNSAAPVPAVQITQAKRGPITRGVNFPAVVRAEQEVTLYAKVAGFLKTISVDRGDTVKEGDVLAEVEAPELLAEQTRFEAERDIAKLDFDRLSEARKKAPDLVVPLSLDTARAKMEMAGASLKRNETLLAYTKIVAPFSGIITKRWVDPGALIPAATASSSPQNAAVVTLMDFSKVRIEVAVPEPESPLIKHGLAAEVTVDELPGQIFKGKISRFAHALDTATRTMATEVQLENADGALKPGMFAKAKLALAEKRDALLVPAEALVVEKQKTSVFVLVEGKAKKLPVKVGFEDGKSAEILEGLKGDENVILSGKAALADGQAVKLVEAK